MTILAAIDENERSKQVATVGYDLATAYDDRLVALHVIPEEDYQEHREALRELPEFSDFSFSQEIDSAERFAREFVRESVEGVDMERVEPRGRVGDVSEEILSEVESTDPRFLVISGRRRSPAGKALFGNTAQRILLNADCPVVSKLGDF